MLLLLGWLGLDLAPNNSGGKTAYKLYYKGTVYFKQAKFEKASGFFEKALKLEPGNFNFSLAYSICLARSGNHQRGQKLIGRSLLKLSRMDPKYDEKLALAQFLEGIMLLYNNQAEQAIPLLRKALAAQKKIDNRQRLSLYYNTLGYAMILNQGRGGHKRADINFHYHVHRRDLERALPFFKNALAADPENESALANKNMLEQALTSPDSIQVVLDELPETTDVEADLEGRHGRYIPFEIDRIIEFTEYDELVLLLDISGSMVMEEVTCMDTSRFTIMKNTAQFLLNNFEDISRLGVGTIGGDCGTEPRLWHKVGTQNRKALEYDLRFLIPDGTTPMLEMLRDSPNLFSSRPKQRRSILLISDGANICRIKEGDICDWVEVLKERNITINVLTFLNTDLSNTSAFAEYTCLAHKTGGRILFLNNINCELEFYQYNLTESIEFTLPDLQKVNCWGPSVKNLWAIFPE